MNRPQPLPRPASFWQRPGFDPFEGRPALRVPRTACLARNPQHAGLPRPETPANTTERP